MRGHWSIAIAGAFAIILAATGLWIDIERGAPQTYALADRPITVEVSGSWASQEESGRVAGQCVPACVDAKTIVDMTIHGMPELDGAELEATLGHAGTDIATRTMQRDAVGWSVHLEVDQYLSEGTITVEVVTPEWRSGVLSSPLDEAFDRHEVRLGRAGTATMEQIGAVEVSALVDVEVEAVPGVSLVAWLDDERLGPMEPDEAAPWSYRLDERYERLVIAEHERLTVRLAADGAQGPVVFTADLPAIA